MFCGWVVKVGGGEGGVRNGKSTESPQRAPAAKVVITEMWRHADKATLLTLCVTTNCNS